MTPTAATAPEPPPDDLLGGLFEGPCHGGPLDGQTVTTRFAAGFVLADRPAGLVWIYDRGPDGAYVLRADPDPEALAGGTHRGLDQDRLIATALGGSYDVVAAPGRSPDGPA